MKTHCIALLLLATCSIALAQQTDMKALRTRYETILATLEAQAVTNKTVVLATYKAELQTLKARIQQAGDLEKTKAVLVEIARFQTDQSLPVDAGIPEIKALVSVCQTRQQALDAANAKRVAVLTVQYDNALAALQRKLVQAGKLDDATAVQAERNLFTNTTVVVAARQTASTPPAMLPTPEQTPQAPPSPDHGKIQETPVDAGKVPAALQERTLTGTQKDDITLLKSQTSPYVLKGVYVIPAGKELRVEAGTTLVAEKDAFISVVGKLLATGTSNSPVVFMGKATGATGWRGITGGGGVTMSYTRITGALNALEGGNFQLRDCVFSGNDTALRIIGGGNNNRVENCLITKNVQFGFYTGSCEADLVSCTVSENGTGLSHVWAGPIRIEKCVFSGNKNAGVASASYIEAHNSIFEKNGRFDVENVPAHAKLNMDFSSNWWGEQSTRQLAKDGDTASLPKIQDGHNDPRAGLVQMHDFLKERPKECGAKIAGILGSGSSGHVATGTGTIPASRDRR